MSILIPRMSYLIAVLFLVSCGSVVLAQHDSGPVTGGGMIGGSTTRTSSKPSTPRRTTTTPTTRRVPPARTTTDTKTTTADAYYQQGEALYNAKKYSEALEPYLKAVQLNPLMSNAWYRIGWIYNDQEQ